ncbi:MAG: hypothetical protein H7177_14105 [Rhizobacter sp.]|nr:hypothetical protein [Bacteriovorax sp.]
MNAKFKYLVTVLIAVLSMNAFAECPQFETALEAAMRRVLTRESSKDSAKDAAKKETPTLTSKETNDQAASIRWGSPSAEKFKVKYKAESTTDFNNRTFVTLMETDKKLKPKVMYFDVENAVQKKLNDSLIGDKAMVDAINNAFMDKFMANLKEFPELSKAIEGRYKDYKSIRLRVKITDSGNNAEVESMLNAVYQKTNREFVAEFEKEGLTKLLPPRTDEVPDVSTWFLAGSGETPLEANMAARAARKAGYKMGSSRSVNFEEQIENMHADVKDIESIRAKLALDKDLFKSGIMQASSDGAVIPTKDMIGILRKIKPSDCENSAEYSAKIRAKVKTIFNTDISDAHIEQLTNYFQKVDSLSPPLFQRERVLINLAEAKGGIVSVDFTGVGVDNAYEQMRALSTVNYSQGDKAKVLKDAFTKIQNNVDEVTTDMNKAKRTFTVATTDEANPSLKPKFSGDDGILMPKLNWGQTQKVDLVKKLAQTTDPSKYRVTFVKTEFNSGAILPEAERSQRVVRAETIEKLVRESVVGAGAKKISSEKSKKMIFAVDYSPDAKGGTFNLIIGGVKPTDDERKVITEAFKRALSIKDEERLGHLIEAN